MNNFSPWREHKDLRQKKLTSKPALKNRIIELHNKGYSINQIVKDTGSIYETVHSRISKYKNSKRGTPDGIFRVELRPDYTWLI